VTEKVIVVDLQLGLRLWKVTAHNVIFTAKQIRRNMTVKESILAVFL